jgi:hypothetical protein
LGGWGEGGINQEIIEVMHHTAHEGERRESMKTIDVIKVAHFDANPMRILKNHFKESDKNFVCFLSRGDRRLSREMANTL